MAPTSIKNKGNKTKPKNTTQNEQPLQFARVIQAVCHMMESPGCTIEEIMKLLQLYSRTSETDGNLDRQIRGALRHAFQLLSAHNAGKNLKSPHKSAPANRERRPQNKNRKGGKRRRSPTTSQSAGEDTDTTYRSVSTTDASISSDKEKKNTRHRSDRSRRRRRRPQTKQKRKSKERRKSSFSNRSRSRSEQKKKEPPIQFTKVLQAVHDMEQSHGCTIEEIVAQLQSSSSTSETDGELGRQVHRALRHAIQLGFLVQHDGRYQIYTSRKSVQSKNRKGGKRKHSPTPSTSTEGETESICQSVVPTTDSSISSDKKKRNTIHSSDRSRSRRRRRQTKQKRKSKERRKSSFSSRSRSRSEQKKEEPPVQFAEVLQAVHDMKQSHGCTIEEIVAQLQSPSSTSETDGELGRQVHRDLRHAIQLGFLVQHDGRYQIYTSRKSVQSKNRKGGPRKHSPTPSTSTEGETKSTCESVVPTTDSSISSDKKKRNTIHRSDRSRSRRRRRQTKQKRKSKNRRKSSFSGRSRSSSEQKKKEPPPEKSPPDEDQNNQQQQQQENDCLLRRPSSITAQGHRHTRKSNRGWSRRRRETNQKREPKQRRKTSCSSTNRSRSEQKKKESTPEKSHPDEDQNNQQQQQQENDDALPGPSYYITAQSHRYTQKTNRDCHLHQMNETFPWLMILSGFVGLVENVYNQQNLCRCRA